MAAMSRQAGWQATGTELLTAKRIRNLLFLHRDVRAFDLVEVVTNDAANLADLAHRHFTITHDHDVLLVKPSASAFQLLRDVLDDFTGSRVFVGAELTLRDIFNDHFVLSAGFDENHRRVFGADGKSLIGIGDGRHLSGVHL